MNPRAGPHSPRRQCAGSPIQRTTPAQRYLARQPAWQRSISQVPSTALAPPATRSPLRSRCAQGGRRSAPPELLGLIAPTAADPRDPPRAVWQWQLQHHPGNLPCGQAGHCGQPRSAWRRIHNEVQATAVLPAPHRALWCWQAIVEEPLGLLALRVPLGPMPAQAQSLAACLCQPDTPRPGSLPSDGGLCPPTRPLHVGRSSQPSRSSRCPAAAAARNLCSTLKFLHAEHRERISPRRPVGCRRSWKICRWSCRDRALVAGALNSRI